MSRLRFTSAYEVLETFGPARADLGVEPGGGGDLADEAPLAYLDRLADGARPDSALTFCAYVLPRREAVSWGCRGMRLLFPAIAKAPPETLQAAETWVTRPDDAVRRAALEIAMRSDLSLAPSWLALGAGWAGGSMTPGDYPVPAPTHLTPKAVRAALLLALGKTPPDMRLQNIKTLVAIGRRLADGTDVI